MSIASLTASFGLSSSRMTANISLSSLFLSSNSYTYASMSLAVTITNLMAEALGSPSSRSLYKSWHKLIMAFSGVTISWVTLDDSMWSRSLCFLNFTSWRALVISLNVATLHSSLLKIRFVNFSFKFWSSSESSLIRSTLYLLRD